MYVSSRLSIWLKTVVCDGIKFTMGQHKIILVMGLKMSQTYSNWFELLFFTLLSMRAKPKETSKKLGACSLRKKKKVMVLSGKLLALLQLLPQTNQHYKQ